MEGLYAPLNPAEDQVRLLEIDARDPELQVFALRSGVSLRISKPLYIALSHPWGDSTLTKCSMTVNGHRVSISQNLGCALEALIRYWNVEHQEQERRIFVWADQICINQQDEAEKNHQVSYMKDIYEKADEVVAWLPLGGNSISHCVAPVSFLGSWTQYGQRASEQLDYWHDEMWTNVSAVLTSSWWSRAWVYQEFMLASRATFLVGADAFPWHDLLATLEQIMTAAILAEKSDSALQPIFSDPFVNIDRVQPRRFAQASRDRNIALSQWPAVQYILQEKSRHDRRSGTHISLSRLISHTQRCECTDARDRVFAILGLASTACGIVPDYRPENTLESVTAATVMASVQEEGSLKIVMDLYEMERANHLPDWMPDLTVPVNSVSYYPRFLDVLCVPSNSRASKATAAVASLESDRYGQRNRLLKVRGRRVGTLTTFGQEATEGGSLPIH